MSVFQAVSLPLPDPAFYLVEQFKSDGTANKVDLTPGFYRDENAQPWILPSVRKAEALLLADPTINHEHLPLMGHSGLVSGARKLIFGNEVTSRVATVQTIAGTGANYLAALFIARSLKPANVWISNPSWINHQEIWGVVDDSINQQLYPYFNSDTFSIDFEGMVTALLDSSQPGDVVILHGCAHNPTGLDLSKKQWQVIADICEKKKLFPLFDMAYQGFASGDLNEDAWAIRHFFNHKGLEFAVAQSFSKNFGLYGDRIGALHFVTQSYEICVNVAGALRRLSRAVITTAPAPGARIISAIINDENLLQQWQDDLKYMNNRMKSMRRRLFDELKSRGTPGCWKHLLTDIGMFSFTGLTPECVIKLREKHHVYLLPSGRIAVTGLTEHNVRHVAESFLDVMSKYEA